jgi:predicted Zn-dependent peptidase
LTLAPLAPAQEIPDRPEKLHYKDLAYEPPSPASHRVVLKNGMTVFIAEDRALPLVNISLIVRTGSYLDPVGKEGLAAVTGGMIRRGGTKTLSAEAADERFDFLAAQVATGIGDTSGSASLNCLKDNLDACLALFVEMLQQPRFQEDRLALTKEQALQAMRKRNDDSEDIERREWNVLLSGEDHFTNRFTTEASIRAITRDDLVAFHRRYFHPANMIAAVSGSFARAEMIAKLERAFSSWPGKAEPVPPVPSEIHPTAPGVYRIEKDVNQGRVSMGLITVKRDSPDVYALEVMNEILGGSGFFSRITRAVRSNEGLAYSAGSAISFGIYYPGRFRAEFQSKSASVAYAAQIVESEIRKLREAEIAPEELVTIQKSLIETFPSTFASQAKTVAVFASDEYTKRDPGYWTSYRARIQAVSAADVLRVAREYLVPEKLVVLVVGHQADIDKGDPQHPVPLASLSSGPVVEVPLRDPMTMKRPAK